MWSALVPDPKRSLTEHFPAVLAHLNEGITGREWRARESSCTAMAELLSGRTYSEVWVPSLPQPDPSPHCPLYV